MKWWVSLWARLKRNEQESVWALFWSERVSVSSILKRAGVCVSPIEKKERNMSGYQCEPDYKVSGVSVISPIIKWAGIFVSPIINWAVNCVSPTWLSSQKKIFRGPLRNIIPKSLGWSTVPKKMHKCLCGISTKRTWVCFLFAYLKKEVVCNYPPMHKFKLECSLFCFHSI